jgi:hypothetical protein
MLTRDLYVVDPPPFEIEPFLLSPNLGRSQRETRRSGVEAIANGGVSTASVAAENRALALRAEYESAATYTDNAQIGMGVL